jgi:acyl dehydratase
LFAESTILSKTEDDPRLSAFAKPGQAGVVKILLRGKNQRGEIVLEITRELAVLKREFRP